MTVQTKNRIGGIGFALLLLVAAAYALWAYYPWNRDGAYQKQVMAADIAHMDGPEMEAFVRALQVERLTNDQKVELWNRMLNRFWNLPPEQMAALLKDAREEMAKNPNSPLTLNAQQLMQADGKKKAANYVAANPAERAKILDAEIARQQQWMMLQGGVGMGRNGLPSPERLDRLKTQIAFWMQQGMKTDNPTERAAVTQFYTDMRARRIEKDLPTAW